MHNYNCRTCQEPMKISVFFHTYITSNGPQQQKCTVCGCVHRIEWNGAARMHNITVTEPGVRVAKLSPVFPYPEHVPYRVGAYHVQFSNRNWSTSYWTWDGEKFHNGPILLDQRNIIAWQGLAGDMEHTKQMPHDINDPLPTAPDVEGDD